MPGAVGGRKMSVVGISATPCRGGTKAAHFRDILPSILSVCMTECDTLLDVSDRAISVRLDPGADAALEALVASGLTQSQAIRRALVETAERLSGDSSLAAEAARLAADERDRREVAEVRAVMDELRAPW